MEYAKGFKFRIYPNAEQQKIINQTLGCARFVYNHFLAVRQDSWQEKHESVTYVKSSRMLEYKVKLYGCDLVKVDTFYPSSQTCSCCGYQNRAAKNLGIRRWTNTLPSGTVSVKPEVNIYCQSNGKGSNAGHLGGFKDTENQVGVISPEIFQKEAGCAV